MNRMNLLSELETWPIISNRYPLFPSSDPTSNLIITFWFPWRLPPSSPRSSCRVHQFKRKVPLPLRSMRICGKSSETAEDTEVDNSTQKPPESSPQGPRNDDSTGSPSARGYGDIMGATRQTVSFSTSPSFGGFSDFESSLSSSVTLSPPISGGFFSGSFSLDPHETQSNEFSGGFGSFLRSSTPPPTSQSLYGAALLLVSFLS